MKLSGGLTEKGVVVGNSYDKYGSRNFLVRGMMGGFHSTLFSLVDRVAPESIHEVGCGEGVLTIAFSKRGIPTRGSDFSETALDLARQNALETGLSPSLFSTRSIYDLETPVDSADLIVCCEVLEHLEQPEEALERLKRVTGRYLIVSVPREPLWRMLNMARGKYLSELGNTPGHLQHWSSGAIASLVGKYFDVEKVTTPVPWTFLLARQRN